MAELTRPFPPGSYPVIVIGSGPGGLQVAVFAAPARRVPRGAVGGPGAGRDVPALAVLPATAVVDQALRAGRARDAGVRALRLEQPPRRGATRPGRLPRRSWTARRTSRPGRRWRPTSRLRGTGELEVATTARGPATRLLDGPEGGDRFEVETADGRYTCGTLVLAVGVAEPYTPPGIGMEYAYHYADVRPAETYAGRRV